MAGRPRIAWIDQARGIGIALVVLAHTLRGLKSAGILAGGEAFRFTDSAIYSFHMPLFFLLSGLFAERRVGLPAAAFVRDKLATLAYPYLVWSVLQTLMQAGAGGLTNTRTGLGDLAHVLTTPILQFWFLYVLLMISLAYYLLRRCGLGPIGVLAASFASWATRDVLPSGPWWPLGLARDDAIYYALGSVADRHGLAEKAARAQWPIPATAMLLGFAAVAWRAARPRVPWPPIDLAVTLCGIAASLAAAMLLGRSRRWDFVGVLGAYSLEIYVAHTIASAGPRIVLQKVLHVRDPAAHLIVGTAAGLILPLILGWLCRRYGGEFLFRFPRTEPSRPRAPASDPPP